MNIKSEADLPHPNEPARSLHLNHGTGEHSNVIFWPPISISQRVNRGPNYLADGLNGKNVKREYPVFSRVKRVVFKILRRKTRSPFTAESFLVLFVSS